MTRRSDITWSLSKRRWFMVLLSQNGKPGGAAAVTQQNTYSFLLKPLHRLLHHCKNKNKNQPNKNLRFKMLINWQDDWCHARRTLRDFVLSLVKKSVLVKWAGEEIIPDGQLSSTSPNAYRLLKVLLAHLSSRLANSPGVMGETSRRQAAISRPVKC